MIAPRDMPFLLAVISFVGGSESAHKGLKGLENTLEWMMNLEELNMSLQGHPLFTFTIGRTFPKDSINCYAFARDNSLFSEVMFGLFHESHSMPPILIIDDEHYDSDCRGQFLFAADIISFKKVLGRLPRWATHRIYCLIWQTSEAEIIEMIKLEIEIFRDAEIIIFIYNHWSTGYVLGQPIRKWKIIRDATNPVHDPWEVNIDGYKNFYGREVKFTTRNCAPFSFREKDGKLVYGIDWSIFKEMSKRMNVTLKYVPPTAGVYAGTRVNNSWIGGGIGNVFRGLADISFCCHWIESSKIMSGIQISTPIQRMCMKYLVPRPTPRFANDWYSVFSPLSDDLWFIIVIAALAVTTILQAISIGARRLLQGQTQNCDKWFSAYLVVVGTLLQGSWPKQQPMATPSRLVVTGWVTFGMLMATSFSSSLVSHLAAPHFNKKPNSIKDLVEMGYEWHEVSPGFPIHRLINSGDPYSKKWQRKQKMVKTWNEILVELTKPKHVIFGAELTAGFVIFANEETPEGILDDYEVMDNCIAELYEGFIYRDGSPFNADFDFYIMSLRESGLVDHFVRVEVARALYKQPGLRQVMKRSASMVVGNKPFTLNDLRGIFIFACIFQCAAVLVFIGEIYHHSKYSTNRRI